MKARRKWLVIAGSGLVLLVLTAAWAGPRLSGWWTGARPGYCPVCRRHEHGDSAVRVQAKGEKVIEVCCLSCGLNYGRQTAKAVTVVSVTDHETGKPLDPDAATFVVGSDVSPCTHGSEQLRLEGGSLPVHWDRCLPSILAFASRESATAFHAQHGGKLRNFQELQQQAADNQSLH